MKKLIGLAVIIGLFGTCANVFAGATTSKSYQVSGTFGSSPTIQVFADDQAAVELLSGAAITLDTSVVTTFPSAQQWGDVDAYSVAKMYVKVSPAGTGWSIVMYDSNAWDIGDLYHSSDLSKTIPWKYGSEAKGTPTPDIGGPLDQVTTWDTMPYVQLLAGGQTVADLVNFIDPVTLLPAPKGIIVAEADGVDLNNLIDVTLVIGLHDAITTPGTYKNQLALEVYVP